MKVFVLGGMKSGKSRLASEIAQASAKQTVLIATATGNDDEMRRRIERHRLDRLEQNAADWQVIEEPVAVAEALLECQPTSDIVVIDCLTLWLTNLLLAEDKTLLAREQKALLQVLATTKLEVVLVSNEVSMGVIPLGELSRRFCDEAGVLHQQIAGLCDTVILSVAGLPHYLKGAARPPLKSHR